MPLVNTHYSYGWMAVALHWLLFLLLAGLLGSGTYSDSLPQGAKDAQLIGIHKQVGVAALIFMSFRLLWRLVTPSVRPIETNGALIRMAAAITHWLLYILVIAQALGGIAMSQAAGRAVHFLGLKLPTIADGGQFFGFTGGDLRGFHELGAHILIALIALHVLAALAHHFYWSDNTLRRMWFGYKPGFTKPPSSS